MTVKTFKLEIITPRKVVFTGDVTSFTAPGTVGYFQVLYDHAPFISALAIGKVKLQDSNDKEIQYSTSGGFVEIKDNKVVMLTDSIESAAEIDVKRAESAKDRAQKRLAEKSVDVDVERARAALARALNRLRIAQEH